VKTGNKQGKRTLSQKLKKLQNKRNKLVEELRYARSAQKRKLLKKILATDAKISKVQEQLAEEQDKVYIEDALNLLQETRLVYAVTAIGSFFQTADFHPLLDLTNIKIRFPSGHQSSFNLLEWFNRLSLREQKLLATRFLSLCRSPSGNTELTLPAVGCPKCRKKPPSQTEAIQIRLKKA
jgi:hypothetical protein